MSNLKVLLEKLGVANAEEKAKEFDKQDVNTIINEVDSVFKLRILDGNEEKYKSIHNEIHKSAYGRLQNEAKNKIAKTLGLEKGEYEETAGYEDLLKAGLSKKEKAISESLSKQSGATSETLTKLEQEKLAILKEYDEYKKRTVPLEEVDKTKKEVEIFKKTSKINDVIQKIPNIVGRFDKIQSAFLQELESKYDVVINERNELHIKQKDGRHILDKDERNILTAEEVIRRELDDWQLLAKAQPQQVNETRTGTVSPSSSNNHKAPLNTQQWKEWAQASIKAKASINAKS